MVPPSGLTLAKGAEDYANWDTGQESKGSVQGSVSIIVDSEWVDNLWKRQSKVQNFRQFKYKEFGNQNAEFSAMEVQRFRQRVCLLEL